ncbi:MAG: exodeoxyribonuclease III [Bdellovibrionales bacterium]
MKIITWNVNGIRACAQKGLFSYLRREAPDMLCLQETKAHPDQLDQDTRLPEGYLSYWSSAQRKGYSGIVTYTKQEPVHVDYGINIRKFDSEGRFVITDHKDFLLFNVYFPNGGSGPERHEFKQEFLTRFLSHLTNLKDSGREIILVGDYNVAYLDIDVHDPVRLSKESGFLPEERQWFKEFLNQGFTDTFRAKNPEQKGAYTWWSYREGGRIMNRGWRIDHICVTPGLAKKIRRAEIQDDVMGSDHCPVLVEFDL